jgi:hypothetical protein
MLDNLVIVENMDQFVVYGKKHNWTHKCGLWELSCVKELILMHNHYVMHQEENVGESILSTCMGFADKKKDNHKARRDLAQICNRPTLELTDRGGKPRAPFCLKPKERKQVMSWMQDLKFPDSYIAGFKRAIHLEIRKINGLKSRDYHIFMERLLYVIFHGYLNDDVWAALAKLSHFYRQLCSKEIKKEMMEK